MPYGDFKDLPRRTASEKALYDKAFGIPSDPKFDGYQRRLALKVYNFFDKMAEDTSTHTEAAIISYNEQLTNQLHIPIN